MPVNYAFIDSQNVNLAIRSQGWILDYNKFLVYLRDKYKISKAFLFIARDPQNLGLLEMFQRFGYVIITKPITRLADGTHKGNVDAELVLQAMIEYDNYEKAIIASGDGDFLCLARYLKNNNKLLKVMIPNKQKYSSLYRELNKDLMFMNGLKRKLKFVQ